MDAVELRRLRYRLRFLWQRSPAGPAENPPFPGCTGLGGRGGDFHFSGGNRRVLQEAMRFAHRTGSGFVYIFFKFGGDRSTTVQTPAMAPFLRSPRRGTVFELSLIHI